MSIRSISSVLTLIFMSTACIAQSDLHSDIVMDREAKELSGWFSAKGEWALFPSRNKKRYNPYIKDESKKCVTIVNGTGLPRSNFAGSDGNRVIIKGYALDYDRLPDGNSPSDRLLSKKYFGSDPVENYCLRSQVFIATDIREQ